MSEALDKLKSLGAQKIHEDTHIPVQHAQSLLHNSFECFSKVQFLGFVSILEREYELKLDTLKLAGLDYFDVKHSDLDKDQSLLAPSNKKQSNGTLYIIIVILIFTVAIVYTYSAFNEGPIVSSHKIDNGMIKNVQQTIKDDNAREEANNTRMDANKTLLVNRIESIVEEKSLKIKTKTKVWLGYIDVESNKRYQKTFNGELDLDPKKKWLLIFGHTYFEIYLNENLQEFNSSEQTRFLYEKNEIKAISSEKFKELNKGRQW